MRIKFMFGAALLAALPIVCPAQEPTALFNGKDLTGWVKRGGQAGYTVEGDQIVGTSVTNTQNTFLCTEKVYGDFVLEYDFKVDPRLNSGVQIRSECFDSATQFEWEGRTIRIPAGRVHGYQVEIDPNPTQDRWWSAGIYDEARRGWLYPGSRGGNTNEFTAQGRKIFKQNDWNHVRIEAVGSSLKTWLNGTPCADIKDAVTARGFIALQVHEIGRDVAKNGAQVRWRNLKLIEVAKAGATTSSGAGASPSSN